MNTEQPVASIDDLYLLTGLDREALIFRIGAPADGECEVSLWSNETGVEVEISKGTRGMVAEFSFPFNLTEFWQTVEEYVDEVDAFEL
jgi:hypothetical protein